MKVVSSRIEGRGVGWWVGLHSHFHVQPNYCVEVVLRISISLYFLYILLAFVDFEFSAN